MDQTNVHIHLRGSDRKQAPVLRLKASSSTTSAGDSTASDEILELSGKLMCESCQDHGLKSCHIPLGASCLVCVYRNRECRFVRYIGIVGTSKSFTPGLLTGDVNLLQIVGNDLVPLQSTDLGSIEEKLADQAQDSISQRPDLTTLPGPVVSGIRPRSSSPDSISNVDGGYAGDNRPSTYYTELFDSLPATPDTTVSFEIPWATQDYSLNLDNTDDFSEQTAIDTTPTGHKITLTSESALHCECGVKFTGMKKYRRENYRRHIKENSLMHKCWHCSKQFQREDDLKSHIQGIHEIWGSPPAPPPPPMPAGSSGSAASPSQQQEEVTKCPWEGCGLIIKGLPSSQRSNCLRHIREKHTEAKTFPCSACSKTFDRFSNLRIHERGHAEGSW